MLESLGALELALAGGILLLAYLIRGITGFGSGLIAIPLLALMFPLTLVVPLVGLLDYMAALSHGIKHREAILWSEILPLLPFSLLGVVVALLLFTTVDGEFLTGLLGGFVLLYAFYSLFGSEPKGHGSKLWCVPAGGLGGLVGTLFGTGGPFYVIYLHFRGLHKTAFRANIAVIFMIDGANRIIGYSLTGMYRQETLVGVAIGLPIMIIAMTIGGRLHVNLSQEAFRKAIGVVLMGAGVALLMR